MEDTRQIQSAEQAKASSRSEDQFESELEQTISQKYEQAQIALQTYYSLANRQPSFKTQSTGETLVKEEMLLFKGEDDLSVISHSSLDSSFSSESYLSESSFLSDCLKEVSQMKFSENWALKGSETVRGACKNTLFLGFEGVLCRFDDNIGVRFRPCLEYFLGTVAKEYNVVLLSLLEEAVLEEICQNHAFLKKYKIIGKNKAYPVILSLNTPFYVKRLDLFSDFDQDRSVFVENNLILCGKWQSNAIPIAEFQNETDYQLLVLLDYLRILNDQGESLPRANSKLLSRLNEY